MNSFAKTFIAIYSNSDSSDRFNTLSRAMLPTLSTGLTLAFTSKIN